MPHLVRLFIVLSGFLLAQASAGQDVPAEPGESQAVRQLITVIEDPVLREDLLNQLRSLPGQEGETPSPSADAAAAPAETQAEPEPGLVELIVAWGNGLVADLPQTTFGIPIDQKANQAWSQLSGRIEGGATSGALLGFAAWAVPGWLVTFVGGLLLRRLGTRMLAPQVPVKKRWLLGGLLIQVLAHIALFLVVVAGFSRFAASTLSIQVFATVVIGLVLALASTRITLAALSGLAPWRGVRFIRFCQMRFYPWLLGVSMAGAFAALGNEPTLRRVIGWSVADIGRFSLSLLTVLIILAAILRHRLAIGRLIFGTSRPKPTDSPLEAARQRLARHWPILAYLCLVLSIVSLIGGHRDNDVLSQMLWSFAWVGVGLVLISILHRLFTPRPRRRGFVLTPMGRIIAGALLRIVRIMADSAVVLAMVIALGFIWDLDIWAWLTGAGSPVTGPLLAAASVVVVAWLIWVTLDAWIASALSPGQGLYMQRRSSRVQTLLPLVRNGVMIVLIVLTGIAVLANIGVDVTPLIAGAGVFGLALSFGSQQLVQDVITGIFILAEDTIAIGDTISTGDRSGVVESISLRTLRLRDKDGALHSIPFSTVKALKNSSRNFGILQPRLSVPSGTDPERVMQAMRDAAKELGQIPRYASSLSGDLYNVGIDEIGAGTVVVSGSLRTSPSRQEELGRVFNGILFKHLSQAGIAL